MESITLCKNTWDHAKSYRNNWEIGNNKDNVKIYSNYVSVTNNKEVHYTVIPGFHLQLEYF